MQACPIVHAAQTHIAAKAAADSKGSARGCVGQCLPDHDGLCEYLREAGVRNMYRGNNLRNAGELVEGECVDRRIALTANLIEPKIIGHNENDV